MSDKVYIGPGKVGGVEVKGEYAPVSRVTMWYDDEHCYTAGDDTGRTLEMENPWATQAIVDSVYQRLKGFVYRPFEAKEVSLDPAVELGDGVNIGGIYSVIGQMDVKLDKEFVATLTCPGEAEIDHEYPYQSAQDRELKRRVKLGESYFGTRISRKDGLVIERTDGETVTAKAVLNAEELSFYDAGGGRVLYFDPASGTYKFMGELNVNDKFKVDKYGNVTMKGSINLSDGSITWGGKGPVKYQFSTSASGPWHDTMGANDKYRRDSLDGGTSWGTPYQFVGVDGEPGADGADGSDGRDASVTRANIERALAYAKNLGSSFMAVDSVGSPIIYGGKIFGSEIYAGGTMGSGGIVGSGSVIGLTNDGIRMSNAANGTDLQITSYNMDRIGPVTLIEGGSNGLLVSGQYLYFGTGEVGSFRGIEINPSGCAFGGKVNFANAEVTGITAVFA